MNEEERAKAEATIKGENFAIYGAHRSGKTTVGAEFRNPCLIAGEPGIKYAKVPEKSKKYVFSYAEMIAVKDTIIAKQHNYSTVVLDTVDSMNNIMNDETCAKHNVDSLMETPRKAGYDEVRKMLYRLIHPLAMDPDITLVMLFHMKTLEIQLKTTGEKYNRHTINFTDKSKELLFTYPHHIMMAYVNDEGERRLRCGGSKTGESGSWNPNVESKQDIACSYEAILEATL